MEEKQKLHEIRERVEALSKEIKVLEEEIDSLQKWEFTEEEKRFLKALPEDYKWIARDKDGDLYVYKTEPREGEYIWKIHLLNLNKFNFLILLQSNGKTRFLVNLENF